MLAFRQKAKRANQAIRRHVYDLLVTEHGLGVGALIEPMRRAYDYTTREYGNVSVGVCTVTSINWDKISVTSDINNSLAGGLPRLDWELQTPVIIEWITPDGSKGRNEIDIGKPIVGSPDTNQWGSKTFINRVISPSPTPLDEEWVKNARQDAFDWLSKKRNLEWLTNKSVVGLVDLWSARYEDVEEK